MSKPDDIPTEVWDAARDVMRASRKEAPIAATECISRAILAAEKRGSDAAIAALTYSSTQSTKCVCGEVKHTPLRRDEMGGYVCLTCIDKRLDAVAAIEKAAEKRGEEREREACLSDLQAVIDDLPSHDPGVCVDMAIRAIRKRGV